MREAFFTTHESMGIRRARASEAEALSALAMASKAYWGYPAAFMAACRDELSVPASRLRDPAWDYFVAERNGEMVGFYGLGPLSDGSRELEALFVAPGQVGQGLGRDLMRHAGQTAAESGAEAIVIQGDPNADGFYLRLGAEPIGRRASESIPGRFLPLYRLDVRLHRSGAA